MTNDILNSAKDHFTKSIAHLKSEYSALQAGRASPSMVENILVDSYWQKMQLKSTASISTPEPQQILISPWDKWLIVAIEKAIRESDLWLNPMNDWASIRINIPQLTEERRKDLVKVVHSKLEESKIWIRQSRHDAKEKLEKLEKDKQISEDELKRSEHKLQEMVDDANKEADEVSKRKEEEVMKV